MEGSLVFEPITLNTNILLLFYLVLVTYINEMAANQLILMYL